MKPIYSVASKLQTREQETITDMILKMVLWVAVWVALMFLLFANFSEASYSYQSFYSQYKEVWTDCKDVVTKTMDIIWYKNHTIEISSINSEKARLQELITKMDKRLDELKKEDWQPIYWEKETTKEVCTDRVIEHSYCWDGHLDKWEQCEIWDANCNATCECKEWFMMINQWVCAWIPMSEDKQPELMKTGASYKKVLKKR